MIRLNLFYDARFDYTHYTNEQYTFKIGYLSSHQFPFDRIFTAETILDLGCGPGYMAAAVATRGVKTYSIDIHITEKTRLYSYRVCESDVETVDYAALAAKNKFDQILLLDIIEHLHLLKTYWLPFGTISPQRPPQG